MQMKFNARIYAVFMTCDGKQMLQPRYIIVVIRKVTGHSK